MPTLDNRVLVLERLLRPISGDWEAMQAQLDAIQAELDALEASLGTMSTQNASSVAITGGTATGLTNLTSGLAAIGWPAQPATELTTNRLYAAGTSHFGSAITFGNPGAVRANLGLGTMSLQNATAVAITGGSATGLTTATALSLQANTAGIGTAPQSGYALTVDGLPTYLVSPVTLGGALTVNGTSTLQTTNITGNAGATGTVQAGTDLIAGRTIYGTGANGVRLSLAGTGGGASWAYGFFGNPDWQSSRMLFYHQHGVWAGVRFDSEAAGMNFYQLYLSGANAYIAQGAWVDAPSDRRLKTNITPIGDPLAHLANIQGCYYNRTDLTSEEGFPAPQTTEYGLIAQDVAAALPEAAFAHDYGQERGVLWNYTNRPVLALLVESVKALAARLEVLEGAQP